MNINISSLPSIPNLRTHFVIYFPNVYEKLQYFTCKTVLGYCSGKGKLVVET